MGRRYSIEFIKLVYVVKRYDSDLLRKKIIAMPYTEWKKMGFSKGILHYMKHNSRSDKPFTLNAHVKKRLENWIELVDRITKQLLHARDQ